MCVYFAQHANHFTVIYVKMKARQRPSQARPCRVESIRVIVKVSFAFCVHLHAFLNFPFCHWGFIVIPYVRHMTSGSCKSETAATRNFPNYIHANANGILLSFFLPVVEIYYSWSGWLWLDNFPSLSIRPILHMDFLLFGYLICELHGVDSST